MARLGAEGSQHQRDGPVRDGVPDPRGQPAGAGTNEYPLGGTGDGPPGQPGRLLEPLQPVGKVLGEFVVHRLVYSPLPSHGLLLVPQYVHDVGEQCLHPSGHPLGHAIQVGKGQVPGQSAPPPANHPLVVHPQGRRQLPQERPETSRNFSKRSEKSFSRSTPLCTVVKGGVIMDR